VDSERESGTSERESGTFASCRRVVLENNVQITAKLFKLDFQERRNFSILIEACGALSIRVDRAPLRDYLGTVG